MIKIAFVLLSSVNDPIPSTRISVLNMLPYLRDAHFDPHIILSPNKSTETPDVSDLANIIKLENFQIVYFQKVHGFSVLNLARELTLLGIKTVFGVCDLVDTAMAEVVDATITVTDHLKGLYPVHLQHKIFVVHDGIEKPSRKKSNCNLNKGSSSNPLRAVLVTSVALSNLPVLVDPPPWLQVIIVGRYPSSVDKSQRFREARWQFLKMTSWIERFNFLRFLLNPRIKRVAWDSESVYEVMEEADMGIIPIETVVGSGAMTGWQLKSENRLTMKMAMGLPIVATPIPSYLQVVDNGKNAYFAADRTEWIQCLSALREPSQREIIGHAARRTAIERYSIQEQAKLLIKVLTYLVQKAN